MAAQPVALNVLDLSQNWDTNTPGFARYDGPTIKWVKRVAFEGVGGMEITSTLHVGTHLDAPNHFITKARGIRWLAIDAGSADHPMNTVIRQVRPDLAKKCAAALGQPLEHIWPDDDIQVMHYDLFPHEIIHIENAGGQIDRILDQRVTVGCFPWRFMGGEAAFCRFVAFV